MKARALFLFFMIKNLLQRTLIFISERIESLRNSFITFHYRPKYAKDLNTWSDKLVITPKTAIILQGPIIKDNDFTLETIRIYKKIFPEAIIILSTWEDEDKNKIEKIKNEKIELILNKKPLNPGTKNINLQIISSRAGVAKAKTLKTEYALKTRTDQRLYGINSLDYLRNITTAFPPAAGNGRQNKRIVGVSLNSFKYRPYGLSDMTIFGQIDDMLLYWGANLDERKLPLNLGSTTRDFSRARICEMYLATEFLKKIGHEPKMTITDSWDAFAKYFCVVDQISLDIFWYKYARHTEHKTLQYDAVRNSQSLNFREWLNLYANLNSKSDIPEKTLDTPFRSIIKQDNL